jgi:large subunit ribosomal protein L25
MVYVVNLDIEGNTHNAIIKDMQFHPVTDKLLHADFYEVEDNKPVTVSIPIKVVGSSAGVREGGKLVIEKRKILVKGLIKNIPAELEIDITPLGIGKSVRAGDMETAGKFDIMLAKDIPVLSVRSTRASAAAASAEAAK